MVTKREEEAQDVTDLDVALCAAALGGVVLIAPLVPFPELSFSRLFLVAVSLVVADALVLSLNWAGVCDGYTMVRLPPPLPPTVSLRCSPCSLRAPSLRKLLQTHGFRPREPQPAMCTPPLSVTDGRGRGR